MPFSNQAPGSIVSEINVTPLVDVMLVLLVIFMITAPMMSTGVEIQLPPSEHAATMDAPKEELTISIDAQQDVFLNDSKIPAGRVFEVLSNNAKLKRDKELFLAADASLPYGLILNVMAAAKRAGAESISLLSDPETASAGDASRSSPSK